MVGGALAVLALVSGCAGTGESTASRSAGTSGVACAGHRTAEVQDWIEPMTPAPTAQLPVTVTDHMNNEVTVTESTRILALDRYGTLASTVYALGLGDNLVGRDVSTVIPDLENLPLVTQGGHNLSAEAVLNLDPTVILTDLSIGPLEVQQQLIDSGIPVVFMDDKRSVDTIDEQIRAVADVLGVSDRGAELAQRVTAEVADAKADLAAKIDASGRDPLRMVFLYLRGTAGIFYWFGEGSGADDLIASLGGIDVAKEVDVDGYTPINAEGLIKADPDMFLLMTGGLE
ncbi:MAG: ABC transporter substrate-binding protein, partial [Actinobacteria bacterium]|nr:ABC transporter substrate-binding protein [Actinomycetota bacterium]